MPKKAARSYSKSSDQKKVMEELSKPIAMVVRFRKDGCPACEMSKKPWESFCDQAPPGIRLVDVEEKALPPSIASGIEGFPTYAVHKDGTSWHHTGALMDAGAIQALIDNPAGSQ